MSIVKPVLIIGTLVSMNIVSNFIEDENDKKFAKTIAVGWGFYFSIEGTLEMIKALRGLK